MGIRRMQGTSAHLEYIGPKGRKKRSSCAYNKKGTCYFTKSSTYIAKCVGRMYCQYFDDSKETRDSYKEDLIKIKSYRMSEENKTKKGKKINNKKISNTKNSRKIDNYNNVTLLCLDTGELLQIEIVSDTKADPLNNKYSEKSFMARKIRFNWIGSTFNLFTDNKTKKYKIVDIK